MDECTCQTETVFTNFIKKLLRCYGNMLLLSSLPSLIGFRMSDMKNKTGLPFCMLVRQSLWHYIEHFL